MSDLARKYRPTTWEEVLGQDSVVKGLRAVLKRKTAHAFLFTGQSGIGKTTLARILASEVGCSPQNLLEIDAATHTGIDAMRAVAEGVPYKGFGESVVKVVVIDECAALSKPAWQSLLKCIEEPPEHAFWALCTTEPGKIPKTIETRCTSFVLNPVKVNLLIELLEKVVEGEGYKTPPDVIGAIARQSFGSPRRALTYLAQCYGCKTAKEALPLLQKADEEGEAIELVRAIVKGGLTWAKAMKLLEPLREQNPESIRLVTLAYLTSVAFGATADERVGRCLELMDAFSEAYNSSEGFAPLLLSLGRVILQ